MNKLKLGKFTPTRLDVCFLQLLLQSPAEVGCRLGRLQLSVWAAKLDLARVKLVLARLWEYGLITQETSPLGGPDFYRLTANGWLQAMELQAEAVPCT